MNDTNFKQALQEYLAQGPDKFAELLRTLGDSVTTAFDQSRRDNDRNLRFFCEVAFPALMLWKSKEADERAMRKMALNNLPAKECYRMLKFGSAGQSDAVNNAWENYKKEFPDKV